MCIVSIHSLHLDADHQVVDSLQIKRREAAAAALGMNCHSALCAFEERVVQIVSLDQKVQRFLDRPWFERCQLIIKSLIGILL
jgi:hypothetical protein